MKHTITAMTDLLFEVAETKERMTELNHELAQLDRGNSDFATYLNPMMGKIEMRISDALDLFFEEVTGSEELASHMLYETGMVTSDGIEYNLRERNQFNNFIVMNKNQKQESDQEIKESCAEMLLKQKHADKEKLIEELILHGRVLLKDVDYMAVKHQHGVRPDSADFFEAAIRLVCCDDDTGMFS